MLLLEGSLSDREGSGPGPARYSAREVGGLFVIGVGLAVIGSGLLFNPWVPRLWQGPHVVDKLDVLAGYCLWAFGIGAGLVWLGNAFARSRPGGWLDRAVVIGLPLALLVLADRYLLVELGLPLWIHDPVLHYRHRPDTVRTLARVGRPGDRVEINRHGFHDDDFPLEKPAGELRGLMIGDSITMGDQLTYAETFSAKLEELLAERDTAHDSHQIINAGVHGYASFQELAMLRESMRFDPDFVAIGFCMNDVTDPSVVKRGFEEAGVDYHKVAPSTSHLHGWLLNETGIGRLSQALLARSHSLGGERRRELAEVRQLAERLAPGAQPDPELERAFAYVLEDLSEMYRISREQGAPPVLLVFPFTFQLLQPELRGPQRRLAEHAAAHGVPVIDFTEPLAARVYDDPELLALLQRRGTPPDEIEAIFAPRLRRYFLDNDHLSEAGHELVAEALLHQLDTLGLVETRAAAPPDAR